ncbi:unnamed protein product [Ambrosiozyma monospora]|uniref:Unnamed protein product n=1 Tax=Ambrosiozyma monospora TaxID=43982 RepID=A0ACB5TD17_AMBMO|nr:unnamed protein product [Ambrosiozyma monospora]
MNTSFDWMTIPGMETSDSNNSSSNGTPNVSFGPPTMGVTDPSYFPNQSLQQQQQQLQQQAQVNQEESDPTNIDSFFNRLHISANARNYQSEDDLTYRLNHQKSQSTANLGLIDSKSVLEMNVASNSTDTLVHEDTAVALSLPMTELDKQEAKTYLRWYNNILSRKTGSRVVAVDDVFRFLANFRIPETIKERIRHVFRKWLDALNIGQYFAMMRLLAHALRGEPLNTALIKVTAPIPKPISIMSRKRLKDDNDNDDSDTNEPNTSPEKKLDLDSFTQFLLTGERPSPKKKAKNSKKVKFSDQVGVEPTRATVSEATAASNTIDFSLPMDQLLERMKGGNGSNIQ